MGWSAAAKRMVHLEGVGLVEVGDRVATTGWGARVRRDVGTSSSTGGGGFSAGLS
jgi:hypothetical protein